MVLLLREDLFHQEMFAWPSESFRKARLACFMRMDQQKVVGRKHSLPDAQWMTFPAGQPEQCGTSSSALPSALLRLSPGK